MMLDRMLATSYGARHSVRTCFLTGRRKGAGISIRQRGFAHGCVLRWADDLGTRPDVTGKGYV